MLAKASFSPQKINVGNKGVLSDSGIKGLWRVLGWSLKGYWPKELPQQMAWFIHKYNTLSNQQGILLLSTLHPVFPHNGSLLLALAAWEYVYYANRNMITSAAKNQCNNVLLVYNKLQIHINTSSPIWTSRDQTPGTFQLYVSVHNTFIEVQALLSQPFGYASFNLDLCWPSRVSVLGLIRVVDLCEEKKRVPFIH